MTVRLSRLSLVRLVLAGTTAVTAFAPLATEAADAAYADATVSTATVTVPMVFPVLGQTSYVDTFLACRSGCTRKHFGQDLMGPKMRPLVAAFNGVVSSVKRESYVGEGNYVTIKGDNGWSANYLHVNNDTPGTDDGKGTARYAFAEGVRVGKRVFAGELLGWSGDSGNAESTAPHLHFELRQGDSWSGTVYNAFSSLNHATHVSAPAISGPHPDGVYIKACALCPTYLVENGRKRYLRKEVAGQVGFASGMAATVSAAEVSWYPKGADVELPPGRAYRQSDGTIWFVTDHVRIHVPSRAALALLGIPMTRVRSMADAGLATVKVAPEGTALPVTPVYEGALLKSADGKTVWYVRNGYRRTLLDDYARASWGLNVADAVPVTDALLPSLPPVGHTPLLVKDGNVVKDGVGGLWLTVNGTRRKFPSWTVYTRYGYRAVRQLVPPAAVITAIPVGATMLP